MNRKKSDKIPAFVNEPSPKKIPYKGEYKNFSDNMPLTWRFSHADKEGEWAWTNISTSNLYDDIIRRLTEFEKMPRADIIQTGSHSIGVGDLCASAQKRLRAIQQDDTDELFSLRINAKQRIFCICDRNIMKILWWDPEHTVCPAPKKHT